MSDEIEAGNALEVARRAFLRFDAATVLAVVDQLDLRAHTKVSAVVGVPLKRLQQGRDVTAFALSAPGAAIKALLELVSNAPLERVVAALGEHAESPSYDQLVAVLEALGETMSDDEVVSVLALAVAEGFPAAVHCRRLLAERDEWRLPVLPERAATALASPRTARPEIKEQRKARREAQKQRKRPQSPPRPAKAKRTVAVSPPPLQVHSAALEPVLERRRYRFTPRETQRFDDAHPLVGSVVIVDVPFDAVDPATPEVRAKQRPALVVGASSDELLVRAIYSSPSPTRSLFSPWRRLGLDHHCYLDDVRLELRVAPASLTSPLGALSDEEWNELV